MYRVTIQNKAKKNRQTRTLKVHVPNKAAAREFAVRQAKTWQMQNYRTCVEKM